MCTATGGRPAPLLRKQLSHAGEKEQQLLPQSLGQGSLLPPLSPLRLSRRLSVYTNPACPLREKGRDGQATPLTCHLARAACLLPAWQSVCRCVQLADYCFFLLQFPQPAHQRCVVSYRVCGSAVSFGAFWAILLCISMRVED